MIGGGTSQSKLNGAALAKLGYAIAKGINVFMRLGLQKFFISNHPSVAGSNVLLLAIQKQARNS